MENGKSLINIGELGKPATLLIEKISEALGGYFKPWQIRRVAQAEAEADKIKAIAQVETEMQIVELTRRALGRFLIEESKKQDNMESITSKALPLLENDSKPQKINDDWVTNFFDKCRLISDEDMQILWAKVLAGEANSPGRYSRRTVNFLGSLDKLDAILFSKLCGFCWDIGGIDPLVYKIDDPIYTEHGINFDVLNHLDNIGLLSFNNVSGFKRMGFPKRYPSLYYGIQINITFPNDGKNELEVGKVLLSKIGKELETICGSEPVPGFLDYVINRWIKKGLVLYSFYQ